MYSLRAAIGNRCVVDAAQQRWPGAHLVALPQSMWLLPITDALLEVIHSNVAGAASIHPSFESLSEEVAAGLVAASAFGPVTYVEAEFFGGSGGQASIVWQSGRTVVGPAVSSSQAPSPGAINTALKVLGVVVADAHDEFDSLHLGRCRSTDRWIHITSVV